MTIFMPNEVNQTNGTNAQSQQCAALAQLARTDSRNLYHFILKRVGDPHEAEDLMQQAFEEALRHLDDFRGDCALGTWVYGIAVNLLRNHLSRSPNRVHTFDSEEALDTLLSDASGPEEQAMQTDWLTKLDYCLEQLPEEMRLTIMMVLVNETSCSDAAQALNVPIGTIRSRICRARKMLKEKMEGVPSSEPEPEPIDVPDRPAAKAILPRMPVRRATPAGLGAVMAAGTRSAGESPFLSSDEIRVAYGRLKETCSALVIEMRKGATPEDYAARSRYLAIVEGAMQALQ